MKHVSYLQRVSRHIGTTAVLVPSRRLWNATSERVPVVADDVPVAEVARGNAAARVVRSEATGGRAEARPTLSARDAKAVEAAIREVEGDAEAPEPPPPARRRAEEPEPITPPSRATVANDEEHENVGRASARPALADIPETRAGTFAPEEQADGGGGLKPAPHFETHRGVDGGREADPGELLARADALTTQQVRLAERPPAVRTHAPVKPQAAATAEAEHSVHIGTIEVHVAPPPAPRPLPAPAPKTAPAPLARGFASTFGLRQE